MCNLEASGNIKNFKMKGKFDDYFQVTIDFDKDAISPRLTGVRSLSTASWGYSVVSDIVRAGKESQRFEVRPGDCGEDSGWSDCDNNCIIVVLNIPYDSQINN